MAKAPFGELQAGDGEAMESDDGLPTYQALASVDNARVTMDQLMQEAQRTS